jgi:putative ABC transport system permease protein
MPMDALIQDLRYAARTLAKSPGFTLVAVLTLALGIGANTAIFSVVDAALLRPYPFPEPDRLVIVNSLSHKGSVGSVSPADYLDWERMTRSFTGIAAMDRVNMALSREGPAEELQGETVTLDFFRILGIAPARGRVFSRDEETFGQDHEVILSDALWRVRFGADSRIVGRSIRLDGQPWLVVGVMPRGFAYPADAQMWMPLTWSPELRAMRGGHYLDVLGRLRPGATVASASSEMAAIARRIDADNPSVNIGWSAGVESLRDAQVGDVRPALLLLLGAVGFVLLIACVNVANLLLSRGAGRSRDHAVRAALGASTVRLARGVMAESLWLGLAGAALGLALAAWGTDAVIALAPQGVPGIAGARVDPLVLAFAAGLGLLTSVLFGLLPAWRATNVWSVADRLRDGGAAVGGRHGRRSRQGLVVTEVALAVVLVVGAGLLLKSFVRLRSVDPGFDPRGVLTFDVSLPDATTPAQSRHFFGALIGRLRALPGVRSAGGIFGLPLRDFGYGITLAEVDGRDLSPREQEAGVVPQIRVVTPDFFRTLGIQLVRGRLFTDADRDSTLPVVVVSETAARRIWGAQDPLGHHFTLGTRLGLGKDHARAGGQVIGVVRDVHDASLARVGRPWVYVVHAQFPVPYLSLALRTGDDPAALVGPARAALAALDPDVPMDRVRTMGEWISSSMAGRLFYAWLIGIFAALALGLAAVGVYGVLSQAVGERTREIGLRVALGAVPREVTALVVRQGVAPAALGVGVGLVLALALTRTLQAYLAPMLFRVGPSDVSTYAVVAALILAVALLAAWIPARRAASVDPVVALRSE